MRARTIGQIAALIAGHLGGGRPSRQRPAPARPRRPPRPPRRWIWMRCPTRTSIACSARIRRRRFRGSRERGTISGSRRHPHVRRQTRPSQTMAGERRGPPAAADFSAAGVVGNLAGRRRGSRQSHLLPDRGARLITPSAIVAAALQRVVDRQEALRLSFLPGKERPLQMIRENARAEFSLSRLSRRRTRPEANRGTRGGNLPRAVRSGAGPALSRRCAAARGGRSRARLRDSSRHRRWLDAGRFRAGPFRRRICRR